MIPALVALSFGAGLAVGVLDPLQQALQRRVDRATARRIVRDIVREANERAARDT